MEKAFKKSIIMGIIGLVFGVYYREMTKFLEFSGKTQLSVLHTHTLIFGVFFTLLIGIILNKVGKDLDDLGYKWSLFEGGFHFTILMLLIRGTLQVLEVDLPKWADYTISGVAGIAHIIFGVFFIVVLFACKKFFGQKKVRA